MGVSSYDMAGSDWATLRRVTTPEASAGVTHIQTLCTKCGAGRDIFHKENRGPVT